VPIAGGPGIHRKQVTFGYPGTGTGEVKRGQVAPAGRAHLRSWLARSPGRDDVAFALEGCAGWRYVAEELAGAGVAAHVAGPAGTAFARGRKRHSRSHEGFHRTDAFCCIIRRLVARQPAHPGPGRYVASGPVLGSRNARSMSEESISGSGIQWRLPARYPIQFTWMRTTRSPRTSVR
jgi:hypothetical protein